MRRSKAAVLRGGKNVSLVIEQSDACDVTRFHLYRDHLKRFADIAFALAVLPLVLPLFGLLWLLVRRDGGPFLYRHPRIGRGGEIFDCLKIRTMVVDSDARLKALLDGNPDARAEWTANFKLKNDPRVTKIGHLLRKTSLDELPQIFNVLMGDMSVVGPRPITSEELERYGSAAVSHYQMVRPGLTGPWQVTGRRENDFNSRVDLDVKYVRNVSFLNDTYYLLATVPEVIFLRGR